MVFLLLNCLQFENQYQVMAMLSSIKQCSPSLYTGYTRQDVFIWYFPDDPDQVQCENLDCPYGRWYHLKCKGVDKIPEGAYFCSEKCLQSGFIEHCVCRRELDEELMQCSARNKCTLGQYFHPSCVGYVWTLSQNPSMFSISSRAVLYHCAIHTRCRETTITWRKIK